MSWYDGKDGCTSDSAFCTYLLTIMTGRSWTGAGGMYALLLRVGDIVDKGRQEGILMVLLYVVTRVIVIDL